MDELYIRVYGQLIPVSSLILVQLTPKMPGCEQRVSQEVPLEQIMRQVVRINTALGPPPDEHR